MKIQIIHNGRGTGDRTEITVNGTLVFEGQHPNPQSLVSVLEQINGASEVKYFSVTDEEIENRGYLVGNS